MADYAYDALGRRIGETLSVSDPDAMLVGGSETAEGNNWFSGITLTQDEANKIFGTGRQ